ncbi:membrane integrity-associated transporter subunit PqiC [Affinibrenneria salicis]|uniref:Membrane integrity-associated transporter subunit PqiC n=1 Tax=Affinibrenneria salicis TaxID=2590031 RepID=A0A5J5G587_9GAMM|nr:membrane integrity-associated transporter subunit PqiC [Affinibrenneria salicis]KAA9001394.1 membrane integrity-associated transporter subunit PqiC [Affinibrenneria salicis]
MMKGWTLALVLLVSACSSNTQKTYYQLPLAAAGSAPVSVGRDANHRQLWIEHIALADYLGGNGLVYQTNDVQYVLATNNLWASPLEQQLQQTLVANLSAGLPGWVVTTSPPAGEPDTLNVTVNGFHGRYDGRVVVQGEWLLNQRGHLIRHPFNIILAQHDDGYDALVKTLAQGWQQVAADIARQSSASN